MFDLIQTSTRYHRSSLSLFPQLPGSASAFEMPQVSECCRQSHRLQRWRQVDCRLQLLCCFGLHHGRLDRTSQVKGYQHQLQLRSQITRAVALLTTARVCEPDVVSKSRRLLLSDVIKVRARECLSPILENVSVCVPKTSADPDATMACSSSEAVGPGAMVLVMSGPRMMISGCPCWG